MAQGHSVDEYLETIYFLAFPIGEYRPAPTAFPTLASRVAEMLHVSRASAGEMLKRLEADGVEAISLRDLAAVLEMDSTTFATLYVRLPLGDLEIAERLQLTRQQVINLRKCARERLLRRMGPE